MVLQREHLCMTMRAVRKPAAKAVTSAALQHAQRGDGDEAMSLIMHGTR